MSNLPYYFDEAITHIKSITKDPNGMRTALLAMTDKEFDHLKYSSPTTFKFMREFERTIKAVNIERRNDYGAMIREAKKRFNKLDIAILELLHDNDEGAYYKHGVKSNVSEAIVGVHPGLTQDQALDKSLKILKRRGLIEVATGLFDEDGFTAGSGYMAVDHKRDTIAHIIASWQGNEPTSLELPL